jgi:uncharacterized protein
VDSADGGAIIRGSPLELKTFARQNAPMISHHRFIDSQRQPWRNGGGFTFELAKQLAADEQLDWRLSIAEIERSGAFSVFAGMTRWMLLLEGEGFTLHFPDGRSMTQSPQSAPIRFSGETAPECLLEMGACKDLNLMVRDGVFANVEVYLRPLVGTMVFFKEANVEWILFIRSGKATLKSGEVAMALNPYDAASFAVANQAVKLEGGGEVFLAKLTR